MTVRSLQRLPLHLYSYKLVGSTTSATAFYHPLHLYHCPASFLHHKMSEWVPLTVTKVRLLWLVDQGLLPLKEVTMWRVIAGEVILDLRPREMMSFTDFHECGFGIYHRTSSMDFSRSMASSYSTSRPMVCCSWRASRSRARGCKAQVAEGSPP